MDPDASIREPAPSVFSYVLSFLLVGVAWGFTTPFIRRAAADFNARQEKQSGSASNRGRSQTQNSAQPGLDGEEEEQELLTPEEQDHEGVRRRSGSRQRQGQVAAEQDQNGDEDDIPTPAWQRSPVQQPWLRAKITSVFWTVLNLLRTPAYSIPLVVNLTGSVWFFLLVGKHGMLFLLPVLCVSL